MCRTVQNDEDRRELVLQYRVMWTSMAPVQVVKISAMALQRLLGSMLSYPYYMVVR
jgi:hypothetical protein